MAYTKQTWDTTSYVNPTRMNHIEDGIKNVDNVAGKVEQTPASDNKSYRILVSGTNNDTAETSNAKKALGFTYNPSGAYTQIIRKHTEESAQSATFDLGNNVASGSDNATYGELRIFGQGAYFGRFSNTVTPLTANRQYDLPNKGGVIALTKNGVTTNAVDWGSNSIIGAKNLNAMPYTHGTSREHNGVTFTVNADGSISTSGTATGGNAQFQCHARFNTDKNILIVPNGKYILSGCPSGGSESKYVIQALSTIGSTANVYGNDTGSGVGITLNGDDYSNDTVTLGIYILIMNGQNANGLVFKPMLRVEADDDTTFTPYAMTNKQITDILNSVPSTNGTYTLKCTVTASGRTFSWV